MKRENRKS